MRANERVTEVTHEGVTTQSGAFYPADLVVWAAGIKAPDWLASLDGLEVNRNNQLVVTATLQTTRDPDIFAFGDCAAAPWHGAPAGGRRGAAARAGGAPAGDAAVQDDQRAHGGQAAAGRFASAISARWYRWANCPPSAT